MKIASLKINGIPAPLGFALPHVSVSWKARDTDSKASAREKLTVAKDPAFAEILYEKEEECLNSTCELLPLTLKPRARYYVRVSVRGDAGDEAAGESWFETGKMDEPWQGKWIAPASWDDRHPEFLRRFTLDQEIVSARLYQSGLGLYEACLNGQKAGNELLAPGCTDYRKTVQAQVYDVTGLLEKGENLWSVSCGNGWYKGRLGYHNDREIYGSRFQVIGELRVLLADGTEQVIATDGDWTYRGSDWEVTDIYDGETLNRALYPGKENPDRPVEVLPEGAAVMPSDRYSLPIRVKDTLAVKEVIHTPAGETVLDFGQNFTGFVSFRAAFPAGTRVTLDHGEILQGGNFYNGNLRTAKARMVYVSDGREETVSARFTYFGFRYVRVSGWPGEVKAEDFTGNVVYSDLETVFSFRSSDPKLNRLGQNAFWGQKSNFLELPTDCPQRDERLGWTGDAQVFSPTACFQMDTRAFYRKFLRDLRIEQEKQDGAVPNYVPNYDNAPGGSCVWGDVATFLPMTLYQVYGDRTDLAEAYPLMRDWVDWIFRQDEAHGGGRLWNFGFHFGDWLAMDGMTPQSMKGGTEDGFIASMYYYASAGKVSEAARILENESDAEKYAALAEEIRGAILREYFSPNGRLVVQNQTAYLLCLNFGVYIDKQRVIDDFLTRLRKDCFRLKGGFVGATMMCRVMAENGLEDLASYFLFQEGFPGWMHCVNLGATTIWERWNSVLDDGSISGTGMNSLNHYSYGSIMEYVYRDLAGLQSLTPGYARVRFAPLVTKRLREADFSYDSASGMYRSAWKVEKDGSLTVRFEVPFGCTAEAILPGTGEKLELTAGTFERNYDPGVDYRLKYGAETRLEEVKSDPAAMEILREDFPQAWQAASGDDAEMLSMSFEDLKGMIFLGFTPQMVTEGTKRLFEMI